MTSQFQRGHEALAAAKLRKQLTTQSVSREPVRGVAVLAVDEKTGKQHLLGAALSDGGAQLLVSRKQAEYPDCRFTAVDIEILMI